MVTVNIITPLTIKLLSDVTLHALSKTQPWEKFSTCSPSKTKAQGATEMFVSEL